MVMLPAICDNCGTIFDSGFDFANVRNISMRGNKSGPCPKCGEMGSIPDGVYDVVDNVINVTALSKLSNVQLLKIRDDLQNAQTIEQQKEIIKNSPYGKMVENDDEKFDVKSFINWLIIIIEVLTALNGYRNNLKEPEQAMTITQDDVIEYMIKNEVKFEGDEINLE